MLYIRIIAVFAVVYLCNGALMGPTYFSRCCVDKHLDKCWKENMNNLRRVVDGDYTFNMPDLNPLQQGAMIIINNDNGTFRFRPATISGFTEMNYTHASICLERGEQNYTIELPQFKISGAFNINYTLQNTSIKGIGSGSVTFINLKVQLHVLFINDVCRHPYIYDLKANYTAEKTNYALEGLDPKLIALMNNNTQQVYQDSYKQVSARLATMLMLQLQALAELVPLYNLVNFHCCRVGRCYRRRKASRDCSRYQKVDHYGYCCEAYFEQCCKKHNGAYCKQHHRKFCEHRHCGDDSCSSEEYSEDISRSRRYYY